MSISSSVQCVIVHHLSPATVVRVVEGAIDSGVLADRIVVVDNSPLSSPALELAYGVRVIRVNNHGYGAAANYGIRLLNELPNRRPLTIVGSHEAQITPDVLTKLVAVMNADPQIAAAGPTLLLEGSDSVWSTGGYFTHFLHRADHHRNRGEGNEPQDRSWLDGALVLYRSDLLTRFPFDESYFLYFEETDLHVRLSRAGHRVVWVPDAVSYQQSSGIPPRLTGRNTLMFQARHFSVWTGRGAVLFASLHSVARRLFTGRGSWDDPWQVFLGWRDGERELRGKDR